MSVGLLSSSDFKVSGETFLDFFSSPSALGIYLAVLMILLAILVAYVLVALHLVRKNSEQIAKEENKNQSNADATDQKNQSQAKEGEPVYDSRFSQLSRIDAKQKNLTAPVYSTYPLDQICTRFRAFAAGKLGLYYDIEDIRRFVAGMGISKLVILRGMSGTGKTSLAYAAGEFFGNSSTVIPIQPMWKERSDMIGYFNEFTKKFNETTMLTKLYEAGGCGDVYITVLDEVNISRIEYYFAEFLSLLELPDPKKRYLDVVADTWKSDPVRLVDGKLILPENMWFIGTANNDDSTFAISDKVYDRAAVIDLERKCTPFVCTPPPACYISYAELSRLFDEAKKTHELSSESREKLARLDAYLSDVFRVSFGNRIMKQIEEYIPIIVACGGSETEALDDILARKILRKLEQLSPAFVKNESDKLLALLAELFGADSLPQTKEYIKRLKRNV
jgi:hypothetical protein